MNRVTSVLVEPTAPSAVEPAKRPTTATSDILNSTCSRLESASGRTDQKDLLGQRAFRQRIRLRSHTLFSFILYILNRARAHRGTASIIRHCAAFARWIR